MLGNVFYSKIYNFWLHFNMNFNGFHVNIFTKLKFWKMKR